MLVSSGSTSLFLLQALKDNHDELQALRGCRVDGEDGPEVVCDQMDGSTVPWCVEERLDYAGPTELVTIDNEEHDVFTEQMGGLQAVRDAAAQLGLSDFLTVHLADAFETDLQQLSPADSGFDFVFLDGITNDDRWAAFFKSAWCQVTGEGGHVAVHSTLTNSITRSWLSELELEAKELPQWVAKIEIGAWEAEQDWGVLEAELRTKAAPLGGSWTSHSETVPIGYGVCKLQLAILVQCEESRAEVVVGDWCEAMAEELEESVQSMEVSSIGPNEAAGASIGVHHSMGLLEPHKRYQNSFTLFQKRANGWTEPLLSWAP